MHAAEQDVAAARETSDATGSISERLDELIDTIDNILLDDDDGVVRDFPRFVDLPTMGTGAYSESSPPLTGGGTYSFLLTIDFGNRMLGTGVESDFIAANNSPVSHAQSHRQGNPHAGRV